MSKKSFGHRLKMLRKMIGDSQKEMAKKIGVAESTVSKYESDLRRPDSNFLAKLKETTNVNMNWLIGGVGDYRSVFDIQPPPVTEELREQVRELKSILKEFKELNTK